MIGRTAIFKVTFSEGMGVKFFSLVISPGMQAVSNKTRPSRIIKIRLFIAEAILSLWFNTPEL